MHIRYLHVIYERIGINEGWNFLKHAEYIGVRGLMIAELIFCISIGRWQLWAVQFFFTLWWNLFMIVSSHDFEESESKAEIKKG